MTSHNSKQVLSQYALGLRSAAPKQFEAFVQCFDAYATEITVAVTAAAQNEVLNAQGRAQCALSLLKLLRECHLPPRSANPPSA